MYVGVGSANNVHCAQENGAYERAEQCIWTRKRTMHIKTQENDAYERARERCIRVRQRAVSHTAIQGDKVWMISNESIIESQSKVSNSRRSVLICHIYSNCTYIVHE